MKAPRGFCKNCNQNIPMTTTGKAYSHRNRSGRVCYGSRKPARATWSAPPIQRQGWEIRWANLDHGTTWGQIEREYTSLGWEPYAVIQLPNSCVHYFKRAMLSTSTEEPK